MSDILQQIKQQNLDFILFVNNVEINKEPQMNKYVVDTNILMGIENFEKFLLEFPDSQMFIPYPVLVELDNNKWKDGDKGFKARRAIRHIEEFKTKLNFVFEKSEKSSPDDQIIDAALNLRAAIISNDISMTLKAEALCLECFHYKEHLPIRTGWSVVSKEADLEMVDPGDYALIRDEWDQFTERVMRRTPKLNWRQAKDIRLKSKYFSAIKPLDEYQLCAIDSLTHDTITVITGKAGTGKTLLSLAYAFQQVDSGQKRKVVILTNPTKARGAEELGFYSGDRTDKLLQNSIGAILASKLGDPMMIDVLMQQGKLEILPVSDIRGYEVSDEDIMYITEAQNLTTDLMKLCIQRCSEKTKIILEGDPETQLDSWYFEGKNNGLKRVIEVFHGFDGFGHINLPNVRRSRVAEKAEEL